MIKFQFIFLSPKKRRRKKRKRAFRTKEGGEEVLALTEIERRSMQRAWPVAVKSQPARQLRSARAQFRITDGGVCYFRPGIGARRNAR